MYQNEFILVIFYSAIVSNGAQSSAQAQTWAWLSSSEPSLNNFQTSLSLTQI